MNFKLCCLCSFLLLCWSVPASAEKASRLVPQDLEHITLSFADLVDRSSPSVVSIYAKRRKIQFTPLLRNQFFHDFFPGFALESERLENSLGSGVVVDSSGLIVSNLHVLEGAEDIVVVTHDRREYQAEIVIDDRKTDLVIIRLLASSATLPAFILGDAFEARVGDLVLAIGNPFGVAQTVTSGIISGLARTQVNQNRYQYFIQTDAAINPGNSGGALINTRGELLGINTAIISPTGSSSGLGFATPVNMIRPIVFAAKNKISLNRAWLGFHPEMVDQNAAEALGLSYPHGVLVGTVLPGSPADDAGLQSGELIIRIEGRIVENPNSLRFFIATLIPEHTPEISMTVHGKTRRSVKFPIRFPPAEPPPERQMVEGANLLSGAVLVNISPFTVEQYDLPFNIHGVLIERLNVRSSARRSGFEPGDVVQRLNRQPVQSVANLVRLMSETYPERWLIEVVRQGESLQWEVR